MRPLRPESGTGFVDCVGRRNRLMFIASGAGNDR